METQLAIANIFFSSKDADFLHVDEHQSFLQVDFNTSYIKFFYKVILPLFMGMMKQFHSTQSNNLQYLYNISIKAVRNGVFFLFFCMQINITYQPSLMHYAWDIHLSIFFLTLTRIINIISGMSCCLAFRVNINSKIQISM